MTAQALMDFGRCPWRWVHSPDPEDWLAAEGPTLLEWVALDTGQAARFFIRRPETYEAMILQCPRCGSPGPAKSCTKCGTLRRNVVKPRPWSNAAKYCSKWTQKREEQALKIIPAAEWDRAAGQSATLLLDEAVKAFIPSCDRLRLVQAEWADEATNTQITLRARISLVPIHEDADQVALGQLVEARNADPSVWESSAWASGAHIRAALALDLWNSLSYVECKEFLWLVVEHDRPASSRVAAPHPSCSPRAAPATASCSRPTSSASSTIPGHASKPRLTPGSTVGPPSGCSLG